MNDDFWSEFTPSDWVIELLNERHRILKNLNLLPDLTMNKDFQGRSSNESTQKYLKEQFEILKQKLPDLAMQSHQNTQQLEFERVLSNFLISDKEWNWTRQKLQKETAKLKEALEEFNTFLQESNVIVEFGSIFELDGKYYQVVDYEHIDLELNDLRTRYAIAKEIEIQHL